MEEDMLEEEGRKRRDSESMGRDDGREERKYRVGRAVGQRID